LNARAGKGFLLMNFQGLIRADWDIIAYIENLPGDFDEG